MYGALVLRATAFWSIMNILFKQVGSSFFLLIGLIAALSWYEWKDSPLWVLFVGISCIFMGVVGAVLTIQQSEEEKSS